MFGIFNCGNNQVPVSRAFFHKVNDCARFEMVMMPGE